MSIYDAENDKNVCIYIHAGTVVGRGNFNKKAEREVRRAGERTTTAYLAYKSPSTLPPLHPTSTGNKKEANDHRHGCLHHKVGRPCSPLRQLPARTLPSICSLINLPPFSLFLSSSSSYSPAPAPMAPLPAPSPSLSSETGYRSATTSTTGTSWAWRRSRVTCSCCGSGYGNYPLPSWTVVFFQISDRRNGRYAQQHP